MNSNYQTPNPLEEWDSSIELIKDSSQLVTNSPAVSISPMAYLKIMLMSSTMGDIEWGGYLLGQDRLINDIVVPKQEVTDTTWKVLLYPKNIENILGTVHSHHSMKATPSTTDDNYLASNHQFTLIYSFSDGLKGWERVKLPSGAYVLLATRVKYDTGDEMTDWLVKAVAQIEEETIKPAATYTTPYNNGYRQKYCLACGIGISNRQSKKHEGYCKKCWKESFDTEVDKQNFPPNTNETL